MTETRLSRLNTLLLILIIAINCFVLVTPFIPAVQFWYRSHFNRQQRDQLTKVLEGPSKDDNYRGPNKLVIPQIFTDQPVLEGPNVYTANKGIWRLPYTSTPDKGGNTVLIGHRFLYSRNPAVFYNLDKIKVGDQVGIYWNNIKYRYQVSEVKVVSPHQSDIEAPTEDSRLTLYTCTPLWTSKNRLVVVAQRIEGETK